MILQDLVSYIQLHHLGEGNWKPLLQKKTHIKIKTLVFAVPADALAPSSARASAGTEMI